MEARVLSCLSMDISFHLNNVRYFRIVLRHPHITIVPQLVFCLVLSPCFHIYGQSMTSFHFTLMNGVEVCMTIFTYTLYQFFSHLLVTLLFLQFSISHRLLTKEDYKRKMSVKAI